MQDRRQATIVPLELLTLGDGNPSGFTLGPLPEKRFIEAFPGTYSPFVFAAPCKAAGRAALSRSSLRSICRWHRACPMPAALLRPLMKSE